MATIISTQHSAHHSCDWHDGCDAVSKTHYFTENVCEVDDPVRQEGWYVSFTLDKSYCPKHSPHNPSREDN